MKDRMQLNTCATPAQPTSLQNRFRRSSMCAPSALPAHTGAGGKGSQFGTRFVRGCQRQKFHLRSNGADRKICQCKSLRLLDCDRNYRPCHFSGRSRWKLKSRQFRTGDNNGVVPEVTAAASALRSGNSAPHSRSAVVAGLDRHSLVHEEPKRPGKTLTRACPPLVPAWCRPCLFPS
jgi:hypothetical protein